MDALFPCPSHLFVLVGLAGLAILILDIAGFRCSSKYPNGPKGLFLLGNYLTFMRLQVHPDQELLRIRQRWGNICMLWHGSSPVIIINTPKATKDLLNDVSGSYLLARTFVQALTRAQRGAIYSSRPEQNSFRATVWPWRLLSVPTGELFRFLRKLYHSFLGPGQSMLFRKYQDYESKVMMCDILDNPRAFLQDTERFTMSVIFSAVYGARISRLDHPVLVKFYSVWGDNLKG